MAQQVTLDLFLNDRGALTSIEDLRAGLKLANEELNTIDRGSAKFQELKAAIAATNTELANQQKQLKGVTSEEFTSAFARIGAGIGSAFAVSTAALNLFGIESENVQKAAASAQNALTIAIGSRQILEGLLSLRIITNIGLEKVRLALTKANILATNQESASETANAVASEINTGAKVQNTAATGAATAATNAETRAKVVNTAATGAATAATGIFATAVRGLYAVISANPFVAILTLLGGLIASYLLLRDTVSDAEKTQKDFNKTVAEGAAEAETQGVQIQGLINIIKDETRSQKDREAAYREVQKLLPGLNDLTLEQAKNSDALNKSYQLQIALLKDKAKLDAAAQIYTEKLAAVYEFQANATDRNALASDEYKDRVRELAFATDLLDESATDYNESLIAANKFITANTGAKKGNTTATQEQINANNRLKLVLDELSDYLKDQAQLYKELGKAIEVEDRVPDIVQRINDAYKERLKLVGDTNNKFIEGLREIGFINKEISDTDYFEKLAAAAPKASQTFEEFAISFATFSSAIRMNIGETSKLQDNFFKQIQGDYDNFLLTIGNRTETYASYVEQLRTNYVKLFSDNKISIAALESTDALISNLKNLNRVIREGSGQLEENFRPQFLNSFLSSLSQVLAVQGKLTFGYDAQSNSIKQIEINQKDYLKNLQFVNAFEEQIRTKTIRGLEELKDTELGRFRANVENAFELKKITENQRTALIAYLEEGGKSERKLSELITKIAEERVEAFRATSRAVLFEFNRIAKYNQEFETNRRKAAKITYDSIVALIKQEPLEFLKASNARARFAVTANQKIRVAQELLSKQVIGSANFTKEQLIEIYNAVAEAQGEASRNARQQDVQNLQEFLKIVQNGLNSYQQALQTAEETATERIETNQRRALERLDAMRANDEISERNYQKKRTDLVNEFEAQRFEVQKRFRIRQLRLDQAQAIANGALAVSRAFVEGGIFGAISGAIVGLATAAQVALLGEQITLAQSYKQGGMIKAQQGLVVRGPSHENGGVSFQNGAYNLEGGESVINRVSSRNYQGLLSQINQMGGGRPLVASFDDSRIVDAIAKTKMEPIRAYVVEQDISNQQAINKRLEQLSRF